MHVKGACVIIKYGNAWICWCVDIWRAHEHEVRTGTYRQLFHPEQLISGKEDAANNFARYEKIFEDKKLAVFLSLFKYFFNTGVGHQKYLPLSPRGII